MTKHTKTKGYSRREALKIASGMAAAIVAAGYFTSSVQAQEKRLADAIAKAIGGETPKEGKVNLDTPEIAENGNTVPISFSVESPMTEADYVKTVHIFADKNPTAEVASIHFTPNSSSAKASMRMRLAKTQNVVAIAQMSDGSVYSGKNLVKVTIGGCGG